MTVDLGPPAPPVNLEHPLFEPIWQAIKNWDICRYPGTGYAGTTGNDVQTILDAIDALGREEKTVNWQAVNHLAEIAFWMWLAFRFGRWYEQGTMSETSGDSK